jgi:3-phenylpropionate/trans-cinnamate dioxygenase ferredoxin subunit
MSESTIPTEVTITVRDHGNLRVTGPITLLDGEGNAFEVEAGKAVFLCRCGGSATKPFCDSSHRANGFQSAVRASGPETRDTPPG